MEDTKIKVSMRDLWLEDGELWVVLHDGENGFNRDIILASGKTATAARTKAKRKLRSILKQLEEMD